MNYWLFFGGVIIVTFTFFDALWTTLWSEGGAGPMTDRLGTVQWKGFKKIAAIGGEMNHMILSIAGPVVMVVTVVTWLILMWVGLVMIFSSDPQAVVLATPKTPGDLTDRIWFVLYTTTTVGNGGFAPNTDFFQVVAGISAASGMALLTLAITYTMQVLTAVVDKRAFASAALSLGQTSADMATTLQNARASGVANQLSSLGSQLSSITEQHKSYPILHYYHPIDRHRSTACAVAALDEALRVYKIGLDQDKTVVEASIVEPLRRSIGTFLEELKESYLSRSKEAPPKTDVDELRRQHVDLRHPDKLHREAEEHEGRRKLLAGLVDYDGWEWDDVIHGT